jgi:hypothetical protein
VHRTAAHQAHGVEPGLSTDDNTREAGKGLTMTIRGICFTNLDDYGRVAWPTTFVAIPHVGDRVEGRIPDDDKMRPSLRVVAVTHREVKVADGARGPAYEPQIRVELHR